MQSSFPLPWGNFNELCTSIIRGRVWGWRVQLPCILEPSHSNFTKQIPLPPNLSVTCFFFFFLSFSLSLSLPREYCSKRLSSLSWHLALAIPLSYQKMEELRVGEKGTVSGYLFVFRWHGGSCSKYLIRLCPYHLMLWVLGAVTMQQLSLHSGEANELTAAQPCPVLCLHT